MALKSVITKLEDVAEGLRGEYAKGDDGRFYLNVDDPDALPAVRGLKANRDELRREKEELAKKYAGVDIEALKAELADLKKNNKGGQNDEQIASLNAQIKQIKDAAASEKQALEQRVTKAESEKDSYIRKAEIRSVLNDPQIRGNGMFLEHHLEGMVKIVDGKAVVVDASGNPRVKNSLGEPLTLKDVVNEMKAKPEWAPAFASDAGAGSGAGGSGNGAGSTPPGFVRAGSKEYFANLDKVAKGELQILPTEG